jgi:PKD repeat protein
MVRMLGRARSLWIGTERSLKRGGSPSAATAGVCVAAVAIAVAAVWTPASAPAATRQIASSARIQGSAVRGGEGPSRSAVRRALPLRVPDRAAYAQAKRRADRLAGVKLRLTSPQRGPLAGSRAAAGIAAAVFGSLNALGLSAAEDIALEGEEQDVTPPDTTGAIGPSAYVEFVNGEVAAYGRSNLALVGSPKDLSTFIGGVAACDPQIKYDPGSERWFYVAIRCDETAKYKLYLGFSKTSDPTPFSSSGWCRYAYETKEQLEDYPKLGLDSSHIIIGANDFNMGTEAFVTAHILAGAKPPAGEVTSCPTGPTLSIFGSEAEPLRTTVSKHFAFTPEPATVADGSSAGYVVAADFNNKFENGKNLMIWQVGGSGENPELKELGAPAVSEYTLPPAVPQLGSKDPIDSLDGRLTQAVAAADPHAGGEEAVWTQHTVAGGAGSIVRWYELLPKKLEVRQEGAISDTSEFVFNGAIAPTLSGGAVIDYNTGSKSATVKIMAQSRVGSAPAGTMNTPIVLGASSAIDSDFSCPGQPLGEFFETESCRWGDYAGASVDPVDPNLVWGSSQINGPTGSLIEEVGDEAQWATRNFALQANDLAPSASFTLSPNPVAVGSPVAFNGSGSSDPDGTIASYNWDFGDGSAAGSGATPSHTYGAPGTYTVTLTVTDNGGETGATNHSVTVKGPQTITFTSTPPGSATVGGAPYAVTATASSGLPVTFSSATPSVCSISGSTVSFVGVGTCTVAADQAGDAEYEPAPQAQQSFAVEKRPQTITFTSTPPGSATVGGAPYAVTATASSGLPVTFSSATPSVCSISGSTVSFVGVGTCTVAADQAGDAEYEPAPQAQQSFAVEKVPARVLVSGFPPTSPLPSVTPVATVPNSDFSFAGRRVNAKSGAVTFTVSESEPGTLSWVLTFKNGKFGAFAASHRRCKKSFVRLAGKCRPAHIVFAEGHESVFTPGRVSFTARPTASGRRALKNALSLRRTRGSRGRRGGLPVTATVTFQSAGGGSPVSHTQALVIRPPKK